MTVEARIRKSVPVSVIDLEFTDRVRVITSPERQAVEEVVGPLPAQLSEGQALAALVQVAREHLRERSLDSAYAEYASHETGDDLEHVRSNRARRDQRERRRSNGHAAGSQR